MCLIPTKRHPFLAIEFKIPPNTLTDEQIEYADLFHSLGACVAVAWNGDQGIDAVEKYLREEI